MFRRIVGQIAGWSAGRQLRHFFQAAHHLRDVQRSMLTRQLRIVAGSDFARNFGLDRVDTYAEFRRKVPILRYADFAPYIERLKRGEFRALLGGDEELLLFALTSGTTAEPKYIPVTRRFVDDYRRGWNIFGLRTLLDHPDAFFRKIVQITSSDREIQTPCGLWAGAITGLLAGTQKWIVRRYYVTPLCVARIKDPTVKMYTVARLAVREDVAFLNTANPSTTLRLARTIAQYGPRLIRDVHDGDLRGPGEIPPDVKSALTLTPNPTRARRLEQILHREGRLLPKHIWRLSFINNWTGGTLKLYLQRFPEYFGDTPVRDLGLLASEGRFSVPISDHTPAGILEITSNLFEFIPEAEYGRENPTVLTADQVRKGENYFLIVSNATGLCRYDIGDLVRVTDFYHQTPMIEFLNKGAHVSSVTGEKVTERQVVEAVGMLGRRAGADIDVFCVRVRWSDPPCYVLILEESAVRGRDAELAETFDRLLGELNIEYRSKRFDQRLGPVRVERVADGHFQRDDLNRLSATGRGEQYKRKFLITELQT